MQRDCQYHRLISLVLVRLGVPYWFWWGVRSASISRAIFPWAINGTVNWPLLKNWVFVEDCYDIASLPVHVPPVWVPCQDLTKSRTLTMPWGEDYRAIWHLIGSLAEIMMRPLFWQLGLFATHLGMMALLSLKSCCECLWRGHEKKQSLSSNRGQMFIFDKACERSWQR